MAVKKDGREDLSKSPHVPPQEKAEIDRLVAKEVDLEHKHRQVEHKLALIQRSTHVALPFFSKLHNDLRMKYRWYYNWHVSPLVNEYNLYLFLILIFICLAILKELS